MIRNYIKTAWRNLRSNKFYSVINISGLAVGLATGIMLLLWVQHERSYDKLHQHYKSIYKLSTHFTAGTEEVTWQTVPAPLSVLSKSIPQIRDVVRISSEYDQLLADQNRNKIFDGNVTAYVDSSFFSIFDFEVVEGNRGRMFPDIQSVVLTKATAGKLFGTDSSYLGKALRYKSEVFTVSGIIDNFPENSSLQYDALFPMGFYAKRFAERGGNGEWKHIDEDMGNFNFDIFVQLEDGAYPGMIGKELSSLFKAAKKGGDAEFRLQNLADLHLVGADGNDSGRKMVRIFALVAFFLLLIASINYVNLSTARSLVRAREVSIRKVIGANRGQLFLQFIIETFLLFAIAVLFALFIIYLTLPFYNDISGKQLTLALTEGTFWMVVVLAIAGTLLMSSIYPALLLASFKPLEALKGRITASLGTELLRKILVVFQFSIAIVLIIGTLVISMQMNYIRAKNLGFDRSYVFTVPLPDEMVRHIDAVNSDLKADPAILNVSTSDIYDISDVNSSTGDLEWSGKTESSNLMVAPAIIDRDFIPTMKIELLEGKNFTGTPADSTSFILNETAAKQMGLKPPYVGQALGFHNVKGTIIGVVKDFNFQSLKKEISPLVFFTRWKGNILYVRTTAKGAQNAIARVEAQYKKYAGQVPFTYYFIDQQFETKYKTDQRAGLLFNIFAGLAIFISCLGLFALVTFTAKARQKEIGVRKVLGASVSTIVQMLSLHFIRLIAVSILIATPIAWWAMKDWLDNFAYRIEAEWWIFVLAGLIAVVIALVTVSVQALRAALANPVESLRED